MKYVIPNEKNKAMLTSFINKVNDPNKIRILVEYHDYLNPKSELSLYDTPCEILLSTREAYDYLVSLDKAGIIHFGLRNYNYFHVYSMEVLTLGKCKIFVLNENEENYIDRIKYFLGYNSAKDKTYELSDKRYFTCDNGIEGLKLFNEDKIYGFDFESAGFPTDADFVPVGIGISSENLGIYIDFRYYSSEEVRSNFMKEFNSWVEKHHDKLMCYYAGFEVNALRFMFNNYFPLLDCMAMVKCDNRQGSLKLNAQNYLHIKSWDDDQDELMSSVDEVFESCNTWSEVLAKYEELKDLLPIANRVKELNDLLICYSYNSAEYEKYNSELQELISNNQGDLSYKDFEYKCHFARCVDNIIKANFDGAMYDKFKGYPFAVTPTSVTGLYCIYDAYYTLMTFNEINDRCHYA